MSLPTQLKPILKQIFNPQQLSRCLSIAIIPGLLFYIVSLLVLKSAGFTSIEIIRDPPHLNESSSLLGFISNIGNWIWVGSASICFFIVFTGGASIERNRKELLFLAGLLSLLLAVDDFFMIHDRYVKQNACYALYAVCAGAILIRHYRMLLAIDPIAFLLAGSLLASSIITDLVQNHIPMTYENVQVLEESFKFVGGATWLYFVSGVASYRKTSVTE